MLHAAIIGTTNEKERVPSRKGDNLAEGAVLPGPGVSSSADIDGARSRIQGSPRCGHNSPRITRAGTTITRIGNGGHNRRDGRERCGLCGEDGGGTQKDPTALPGLDTAIRELAYHCPSILIETKAVRAIRKDTAPRSRYGSTRERQLRATIKLGYGITLVGLICPIYSGSYFAGRTGGELKWIAIPSGLVALPDLLLAGWYRVQLGRFGRAATEAEQSPTSVPSE